MTSGTATDATPTASHCFKWTSIIRVWNRKARWSFLLMFHTRWSLSALSKPRKCEVQLSGCVETNSCVAVNLVLLLLLCLLSCGIRMVEDYERLFPWQPSLSNTVKYIACASKHQGVYIIPTCGWPKKENKNKAGSLKTYLTSHLSYILTRSWNVFLFFFSNIDRNL